MNLIDCSDHISITKETFKYDQGETAESTILRLVKIAKQMEMTLILGSWFD